MEFTLYRLQIITRSAQIQMFALEDYTRDGHINRALLLRALLSDMRYNNKSNGAKWVAGNVITVSELNDAGYLFKFGRLLKSNKSKYKDGNFIEEHDLDAIATDILIDIDLQVLAIAKRSSVAEMPRIANALQKHLSNHPIVESSNVKVELEPLKDPESLVQYIQDAFRIGDITVDIKHPNAFDTNEDFVDPLQKALSAIDGDAMTAKIKGTNLNKPIVEDMARNLAARGSKMSAKLQQAPEGPYITKTLENNPVVVEIDENKEDLTLAKWLSEFKFNPFAALLKIRQRYISLRGKQQ